ncbi:MAG: hypothetical protein LBT88_04700, partial [Oscillospiraceae bacterium]|nr:hypothetical protein [Oscillospiraceae bacterium]
MSIDLAKVPFSRRLSYISATVENGNICVHVQRRTYAEGSEKSHCIKLFFTADGKKPHCEYSADVSKLTVSAENAGYAELAFDDSGALRVRCKGVSLQAEPNDLFDVAAVSENEYAIFERGYAPDEFTAFDDCVRDAQADFDAWYAMYPEVGEKHDALKRMCVYMIWVCQIAPRGELKEAAILFSKPTEQACFSWHQVFHSLLMNDADHAVQTLMNLFPNMDAQGELPDLVDDRYVNITATKPPIHGLAALIFLERFGNALTPEHCRKMYEGLSKLCDYWTRKRGFGQTLPFYKHGCESGYDFSAMFAKGAPVIGPDLLSYCILLSEACGKLAERLNLTDSSKWFDLSEQLLSALLSDFWIGTRFAARLADSYEIVEFDELEAYLPMILGGRLPENIINAMAEDLADLEHYFT